MPIELKITVDDPSELAAIVSSLHGQMVATAGASTEAGDETPKKTRGRKKADKGEEPVEQVSEPVEEAKAEPVAEAEPEKPAEEPKADEVPTVDALRAVIADAINKLPGGQDEVRQIMASFVPEGEKVIMPNVPEDKRAELIHMLKIKMEQA